MNKPVEFPMIELSGDQFSPSRRAFFKTSGALVVAASGAYALGEALAQSAPGGDRKSTRLNSSHVKRSRMPSSA